MVTENLDRLLQAPCQIEVIPSGQIPNQVVDACDTVFDQHAANFNVGVKVHSSTPILNSRDKARAQRCDARIMVPVLLHIDRMPVFCVRDSKNEVNHLG